MIPNRLKRVSELLAREISELVQKEVKNLNAGFVSVTGVEVSPDLSFAKVFVSTLSKGKKRDRELDALNRAAGFVRKRLGENLTLKRLPSLRFYFDETLEKAARINEILMSLPEEDRRPPDPSADDLGTPDGTDDEKQ